MSLNVAQILQDDFISPMVRKTAYGLATTCVLGVAVYAGYRVAAPGKHLITQHRHPELNDQVSWPAGEKSIGIFSTPTSMTSSRERAMRKSVARLALVSSE